MIDEEDVEAVKFEYVDGVVTKYGANYEYDPARAFDILGGRPVGFVSKFG